MRSKDIEFAEFTQIYDKTENIPTFEILLLKFILLRNFKFMLLKKNKIFRTKIIPLKKGMFNTIFNSNMKSCNTTI